MTKQQGDLLDRAFVSSFEGPCELVYNGEVVGRYENGAAGWGCLAGPPALVGVPAAPERVRGGVGAPSEDGGDDRGAHARRPGQRRPHAGRGARAAAGAMRTSALRPWLRQLRAAHFEAECATTRLDGFAFRPLVGMEPERAAFLLDCMRYSHGENGRIILAPWVLDELEQAGYMLTPGFLDLNRLEAQAREWGEVHDPGGRFESFIRTLKAEGGDGEPLVSDEHLAAAEGATYSNMLEPITPDAMRERLMQVLAGAMTEPKP
jgi:hypothetical protein